MSAITLSHISKIYHNGFTAVKDFNLEIGSHEFIVFVGPSGCGKSTTLRMIAGLEEISKGELWIGNRLVNHMDPGKRNLAMVFQNYALYPNMTVYQNMAFGLKAHKVEKDEIDRRVRSAAKMLKIESLLDRRPAQLSGGQKQRVAIGSAIVRDADAYLLDEPLSNLDAKLRTQMRVDLKQIYDKMDATFIYVTHDQVEAMTLATRIVVMKVGTVQQVGTPQEIYENPVNRFVAGFVGLPQMNFLKAELIDADGKMVLDTGTFTIPLPEKFEKLLPLDAEAGTQLEIGIRPEDISLAGDARYAIPFAYEMRENLGSHLFLHGRSGGEKMTVRLDAEDLPGDTKLPQGEQSIPVFPDPEKIHLFDRETGISLEEAGKKRSAEALKMASFEQIRKKAGPYCYIIPSAIIFAIFLFYPFIKTIYLSLYKTNKMGQAKLFVGLGNHIDLLTSDSFRNSLAVTAIFVVIVVIGGMLLGLIGAVLCNKSFPGIRFFSTAYALPMSIASSSAALIFKIMLDPTIGIVNKLLQSNINWLRDPQYALVSVAVLTAWLNSGINFLYFSAGLANIDEEIYERASIDGASSTRQFFQLTLPGLRPIMFYTVVVNIIQDFQSFGQVKILTQGGPGEATNLIVYSIYRDAFFNFRFGSAAAESVVLFLIIMVLTLLMFKAEKKGGK